MVGQSSKRPVAGEVLQSLEPPPQFGIPDAPMREAPIMSTTVPNITFALSSDGSDDDIFINIPVTIGGNTLCNMRGGTKDIIISKKEQINDVPIRNVFSIS
jgi:hypothetical protein